MNLSALTEAEVESYELLTEAAEAGALVLIRTALDGVEQSAVAVIRGTDDGGYDVHPLALLIDDALFGRLTDPAAGLDLPEVEVDPAEVRDQELADRHPDIDWDNPDGCDDPDRLYDDRVL